MTWNDDELAECQRQETRNESWPAWKGEDSKQIELYRLARIGLRAEQLRKEWATYRPKDLDWGAAEHVHEFFSHPAWSR